MIIKCPQCSTGYSIPENMIGEKPRKMRCSRCKNVFTIVRRQEAAPTGYEEFTGAQHLPDEFAFLKESEEKQDPPAPAPPAPPTPPAPPAPNAPSEPQPAPQATEQAPPATPEGLYKSMVEGPSTDLETIPLEPKVVSGPTKDPDQDEAAATAQQQAAPPSQPEQAPPAQEPAPPQAPAPPAPPQAPQAAPPVQPSPPAAEPSRPTATSAADDIYGGTASAWEMEAPLELGGFAIQDEAPQKGQSAGKFITVIIILIIAFFVFVAFRNGWSLNIDTLGDQVSFAFSGDELEVFPEEVEKIEATVTKRKMIIAKDKTPYLVVSGEVINSGPIAKAHVVLRGQLVDAAGIVTAEVRSPCGKTIDESVIETTEKGKMSGHYRQAGDLYNCHLSANGSTVYQLVFEEVPLDYDSSYSLEVRAVAARLPD